MIKVCQQCGREWDSREERHRFCSKSCSAKFTNERNKRFDITPDALKKLVWEMPVVQVASRLGVSGNAIVKRCRVLGIDVPERGYWNRLWVGKCDREGKLTIPLIACACGCGQLVPKWSGRLLRPRRCVFGHNITHHTGGWSGRHGPLGSRRVDPNVVAIVSCRKDWHDDLTKLVTGIVLAITHRHFCDYLGPVWEAVSFAIGAGETDADALTAIAKEAIKSYWRETRGHHAVSIDRIYDTYRIDVTKARPETSEVG